MLLSIATSMIGLDVVESRGERVGKIRDLYFDDVGWVIRYLVVDTGGWLDGKRVLISPVKAVRPDWDRGRVLVLLSRQQIEESPIIATAKPVSEQHRPEFIQGWPILWQTDGMGGPPAPVFVPEAPTDAGEGKGEKGDPHLRSAAEVIGYHIQASDGPIGHVENFLIDPEAWVIRRMVVDTGHWLRGKRVEVDPQWIGEVSWDERKVHVAMTREALRHRPEVEPAEPVHG